MKQTTTYGLPSRMLAGLLSLCMILTTFIGLGFFPVVHAAAGGTLTVNGDPYTSGDTITGGTVTVNGEWSGHLVINGNVTIEGTGTIKADGDVSAIHITGGNVTLKGDVTVTGGTGTWLEDTGLELAGRCNVYYTNTDVNFRSKPSFDSTCEVYETIPKDKPVAYLGEENGSFSKVQYKGKTGWLWSTYIDAGGTKNGRTLVGGGVYVENGTFNFVSGTITQNTAHRGGGIFVNQGATLIMKGGTVSYNETIDTNASHDENHNLAGEGGGIFVYGTALITGGEIKKNVCNSTTDLGGGGLYVNNNGKATLHNAIIKANTADGFGGGIAGCCHGAAALISTDGAAVYDNIAKGTSHTLGKHGKNINATSRNNTAEIIDHYKESTGIGIKADNSKDLYNAGSTFVNNYMVGGGSAQYECIYSTKNDQGYLEGKTVTIPDSEVLSFDKTDVGLVAHPTEEAKEDAENERNTNGGVLIEGNTSKVHGGGIGCNGTIVFGSSESHEFKFETLELSLDAAKTFNGAVPTGKKFTFGLYYNEACTQEAARATNGADGTINFSFTGYQQISKKISNKKPVSTSSDGKRTIVVTEGTLAFYLKEIVPSGATSEIYYDQSVYKIDLTIKTTTTTTDEVYKPADDSNNNVNVKVISIEHVGTKKTITKIKDEYGNVLNEEPVSSGIPTFNNTDAGQLIVSKTVTGSAGDKTKAFNFEVTFTAPDGKKAPTWEEVATLKFGDDSVVGHSVKWNGSTLTFTLKHGDSVTISNLPVGTKYEVEETDANQNGYKTTWNCETSGTISAGTSAVSLTCTNEYAPDDAKFTPKVEKTLTGAEKLKDGQSLTFEFTIEANEGTTLPEGYNNKASVTYTGTGSAIEKVQTALFGAITYDKPGTYTYTITETAGDDARVTYDGSTWTLTVVVHDDGKGQLVARGTYKKGETESNTAAAKFTNTYETGDLTVTKKVTGSAGDKTKEFNFTVALDDKTINGTFGDMEFTNGVAKFTLKDGESKTAKGLPAGVGYTVTETEANADNYTTKYNGEVGKTNATGTITTAGSTVIVENNRVVGSLKIKKVVDGLSAEEAANKEFKFTVTGPNGYKDENVTVKGNGETTLENLVPGEYTITENETDAQVNGYTLNVTYGGTADGKITVVADETASTEITVTNTYTPEPTPVTVEVSVTKVWEDTGNEDARPESVTVQLYRDGAAYDTAVTLNGDNSWSHTWTDLPDGHDYTVSETNVPEGYTSEATSVGNRWTITNTYTPTPGPATVEVSVSKVWEDTGNEDARPESVTVQLYRDEEAYGEEVTLNADNDWSHTWTDLPDGHEYTVSETNVPAGYTSSATSVGNIWTITNTYDEPKPVYGSLTITKVVEPNGAPVDGKTYTFTVTGPSYPAGHTVTITGSGETTLTDLVPGEYTIAEADANITGFTWTYSGNVTVAVTAGGTATAQFTNTYEPEPEYGSLTITKSISGGPADIEDKTFSFTVTGPNGSQTVTITGEGSATLENLVPGTYTVTEADASVDGWNWQATGTGPVVVSANEPATTSITNTYSEQTGGLSVSKTVTGSAGELNRAFNFTVTLDTAISGTYGGMTFTNGVARFTLRSGESVTASGLPVGTGYTVVEAEANEDGYTTTSTGTTGTIAENVTSSTVFVNTNDVEEDEEYGGLTVTKTVTGTNGELDRAFNFTVTLDDTTVNGTYGGMTFTNGVAGFTLRSGESVTASGLPVGVGYTVTEAEANLDGYTTTATGMTGTIAENVTSVALFTNHRDAEVPGALTIRKAVVGGGDAAANMTYTFTVTGPDGYSETVTITGSGTATLNDLVPGEYTVTEADANIAGHSLETTGTGNVTVTANMTAEAVVTNTYTNRVGGLTVTKTVTGIGDTTRAFGFTVTLSDATINGTYGGMTFVNGAATFTLSHGESVTAAGLPDGIGYTVTETGANSGGYITSVVGASAGTITADTISAVEFINDMPVVEYGSLSVTKTVTGAGDTTTAFNFTVTLADTTVNGTYGDMTFVNGVATFTLRHGETATATGLPAGTNYVVSEEAEVGYTTSSTGAVGAVPANGTAAAEFVNYMPMPDEGSLTVTKVVSGNASNTADAFTFVIALSDTTINGTYGDMTFANGVATVMLRHGETSSASGLPAGINYTVTELEANTDNYMTYAVGDTGTIPAGGVAQAVFFNRRNVTYPDNERLGTIVMRKEVSGSEGELDREFHFTITLTDATVNGTYGELTFTNGVATFALRDGESVWARDLPIGVGYTVTELEANYDGYETTSVGAIGVIAEDTVNEVRFVNHRGDSDEFDEWEDLFDPDIPLSDFPFDDFDDWDIPLSDIDLVSVTGDIGINTGFWMIAMTVSLTGIILTLLEDRRKRGLAVMNEKSSTEE